MGRFLRRVGESIASYSERCDAARSICETDVMTAKEWIEWDRAKQIDALEEELDIPDETTVEKEEVVHPDPHVIGEHAIVSDLLTADL